MSIQTQELNCLEGAIGVITLDAPEALNALTSAMFDALQSTLDRWSVDDRIRLVLLRGNGERGFSAGGDIRQLYQALTEQPGADTTAAIFAREYRVDYTLHCYPKPVITLAHGVVMGGGMGLLQASRYRLVTPDAMLAMPEISIGLFPDVGASWFLNRLPEGLGLFLGLTGAPLNATDAQRIGLTDFVVAGDQRTTLLDALREQRWSGDLAADDNRLFRLLNRLPQPEPEDLPASNLARHEQAIAHLCRDDELPRVVDRLLSTTRDDPWWQTAIANLRQGCPVSAWLVHEQLRRGRQMALKDIFRMELVMVARCGSLPDLMEGIRARMIHRDQAPQWSCKTVRDVSAETIARHFVTPWQDRDHPLADL